VDPISVLVTAIIAGAATGLKPTAERIVKDAYAGLRRLIVDRYHQVAIDSIERAPDNENRQGVLKDELAECDAASDTELLMAAKELLAAIETTPSAAAAADEIGVSLERVKAASLSISEIEGGRTGVRLRDVDVVDDIVIKGIRTGNPSNPKAE